MTATAITRPSLQRYFDVAAWIMLFLVAIPPVLSSGRNLYALGQAQLGYTGHWALLVPLSVDAAALACVFLTLRAVHAGRSAGATRVLVVVIVGLSAWSGWQEALTRDNTASKVLFPVFPILAAVILEVVIRQRRQDVKERQGAVTPALPQFRLVHWLVDFGETRTAWAAGARHGITAPDECRDFVREADELADLDTLDASRYAVSATGSTDAATLRAWLRARGVRGIDAATLDAATLDAATLDAATRSATRTSSDATRSGDENDVTNDVDDATRTTTNQTTKTTLTAPSDTATKNATKHASKAAAIRAALDEHPAAENTEIVEILSSLGVAVTGRDVRDARYNAKRQKTQAAVVPIRARG